MRDQSMRSYEIVSRQAEAAFDDAAALAAQICRAPIALITLMDGERQWIKARAGLDVCQSPRAGTPCAATALSPGAPLIIPDLEADPRFVNAPLLAKGVRVRFYAGVALVNDERTALGTLCVMDIEPRTLEARELRALEAVARQIVREIESRRNVEALRWAIRKQLETEQSLRLLGSAVENVHESILITDADLEYPGPRIVYVNPEFTRLSGYEAAEVLGKTPRILQGPLTDRKVVDRLKNELLAGKIFNGETVNYRKDGKPYQVEWQVAPIRNSDGAITHYVSVQRDVSERRRQHEELLHAKEIAESANQAKSEFLSRMSHELRTPLHAILGFSQLLQRRGVSEQQAESLVFINDAGKHLLELINEVLDLSRIECRSMRIAPEAVGLLEILSECRGLVLNGAAQRGVTIEWDEEQLRDRHVMADRNRLKQALLNILSNGIKYNRENGRIQIECNCARNGSIRLAIRDTGIGIDPEKMKKLFLPFERLGAEQTTIEGTGIGLALSKKLINLMGGALEAESKKGVGSVFSLVLPGAQTGAGPSAIAAPPIARFSGESASGKSVLYVEDNPVNVCFMEAVIRECAGIRLITTGCGQKAIDLVREHAPDLILLDLHLPDIDGDEVLVQIRQDARSQGIPTVILSADAMSHQAQRLLELGANDYLTKPLDVEKVLNLVHRYLVPSKHECPQ